MNAYTNIYFSKNLGSLKAEFPGRIYLNMKNNGVRQNNKTFWEASVHMYRT